MSDEPPVSKACTKCGVVKLFGDFYKNKIKKDGVACRCKDCVNEYEIKRIKSNPERAKKNAAKYRAKNQEKIKARGKEYSAQYRAKNPEKQLEAVAKWRKENPEKAKANANEWRKNNPVKVSSTARKSQERRIANITNAYIAKIIRIPVAQLTPELSQLKREQLTLLRKTNQLKKEMKNVK